MAIKIKCNTANGVPVEYHRIALVSIDVGNQNTVLVHSYLSESGRQVEKDYAAGLYNHLEEGFMNFPYVDSNYFNFEYDPDMTVSKAYEILKTLPQFEGAEDV